METTYKIAEKINTKIGTSLSPNKNLFLLCDDIYTFINNQGTLSTSVFEYLYYIYNAIKHDVDVVNHLFETVGEPTVSSFADIVNRFLDNYYTHNFDNGLTSKIYTISGKLSTSYGEVTYDGITISQCLKVESNTSISFDSDLSGTLILVFNEQSSGATILFDDINQYAVDSENNNIIEIPFTNEQTTHTIRKGNKNSQVYLIRLIPNQ